MHNGKSKIPFLFDDVSTFSIFSSHYKRRGLDDRASFLSFYPAFCMSRKINTSLKKATKVSTQQFPTSGLQFHSVSHIIQLYLTHFIYIPFSIIISRSIFVENCIIIFHKLIYAWLFEIRVVQVTHAN